MMMIYGMLPFMRQTLPYNQMSHDSGWNWPSNNRAVSYTHLTLPTTF